MKEYSLKKRIVKQMPWYCEKISNPGTFYTLYFELYSATSIIQTPLSRASAGQYQICEIVRITEVLTFLSAGMFTLNRPLKGFMKASDCF